MSSIIKVNTIQDAGGNALLTSNGSGTLTTNNIGGKNTPAFMAYLSGIQNVSDNTVTKVQCDTEHFDTASAYDNSTNYRFTVPSGEGGKYLVYASLQTRPVNNTTQFNTCAFIYKNGSNYLANEINPYNNPISALNVKINVIISLSAGDYLEFYGRTDVSDSSQNRFHNDSAHTNAPTIATTHWGAYKIIE